MIVAKKRIAWPDGPTDQVVFAWFRQRGISPDDVRSYAIRRNYSGDSWIEVEFLFDPDFKIDITTLDSPDIPVMDAATGDVERIPRE